MQFNNPGFLYALIALAIPIIVHLFEFRRYKTVLFSNIDFLKAVQKEQKSVSKIRNLLILLARLLTFFFLIMAFAQPFIPISDKENTGSSFISIYIDNSMSMEVLSTSSNLLMEAKSKAKDIVNSLGEDASIQIISNELSGKNRFLLDKSEALLEINEINLSPSVGSLKEINNTFLNVQKREKLGKATLFLISDFQENTFKFEEIQDSLNTIILVPVTGVVNNNISVDSVWFEAPIVISNQMNNIYVKTTNYGDKDVENLQLTIQEGGRIRPAGLINLSAGESKIDSIPYSTSTTGFNEAQIRITDYPVSFDDNYHITFPVKENVEILAIGESNTNSYIEKAFAGSSQINVDYTSIQNIKYDAIKSYDLITLIDTDGISTGLVNLLNEYVIEGGNLLVFPPVNKEKVLSNLTTTLKTSSYQSYLNSENKVSKINTEEFIFSDVFSDSKQNINLPEVKGYYPISLNSQAAVERILEFRNGSPYLIKESKGQGHVFLCASPLDREQNNLTAIGEIFVPMLYKIALTASATQKLAYTIGSDEAITVSLNNSALNETSDLSFAIEGPNAFIPNQQRINNKLVVKPAESVNADGIYNLVNSNGDILTKIAYNFDRLESDLTIHDLNNISESLPSNFIITNNNEGSDLPSFFKAMENGKQLWKWCLILALVFILAEVLLIRTKKH